VIMGRTEATLLDAQLEIRSFAGDGATVEIFVGDALDESQVREGFSRAAALGDRLAIAVSVVGGGTMKPLLMFEPQDVMDDLERNILSAFLVIRDATPFMAESGGSIVCISSDAATIPWPS
jgi:NAD(P)-dependent dehydrogenase (short-subunit alcohol dehydrogenase family)